MEFHLATGRNDTIHEIAELARVAEDNGFTHVNFPDQPPLNRDVFLCMAVAAQNTKRILVGPGVTTPYTYHPSVIVNATATVDEMSGGRAYIGLGVGGSAVMSMGLKPRPVQELREASQFITKFMVGEEAEYKGARIYSDWVRRPMPFYVAVDGPKGHLVAGEFADGVFVQSVHPEVIRWRRELLEKGASKGGRDPSKISIVPSAIVYVTDSREDAWREVAPQVSSKLRRAYWMWRSNAPEMIDLKERLERVDPGLVDEILRVGEEVNDLFDEHQHEKLDAPHARPVTQRLIDYFLLVGSADEICERLYELQEIGLGGVMCLVYTLADRKGMIKEIGDRIIPNFRS